MVPTGTSTCLLLASTAFRMTRAVQSFGFCALVKPGVQLLTVLGAQGRREEVEARHRLDD